MGTGVSREQVRLSRAAPCLRPAREFSLWARTVLTVDFSKPHVLLAHMRVCVGVSRVPRGPAACGGHEARAGNRNTATAMISLTLRLPTRCWAPCPTRPRRWRRGGLGGPVPAVEEPGGTSLVSDRIAPRPVALTYKAVKS